MDLAGTRIGPYEVIALIGAGAMGEVYRAHDTRLNRSVAVKVLPQAFAVDEERLARFHREAQLVASLNHPNIAGIFGLEESHAGQALILELVEGPTLEDLIARGSAPVAEVLAIARQIAQALETAHRRGIVHRDLKPSNVKVRLDGTVKVLDFGLARITTDATSRDPSLSQVATSPLLTSAGALIGTPAYMSPEQAKAQPADTRSDIWAFGCLLFELLSGQRAFSGISSAEVLARVIECDPDWTAIPATTPQRVAELVRRCLEKDPKRRLQGIGDAKLEIETAEHEMLSRQMSHAASFTSDKSILVLPFTTLSHDVDDGYFGEGLTDELIADLSRVADLRVVPSAASFRLKNTDKDLATIAREANARYIVEGKVRKAGRTVRITSELVDVRENRSIWADKYTGELEQVFELQERVSAAIAAALQLTLRPAPRSPKPEAREAFLKGRHSMRQATVAGLRDSVLYFQQAIEADPDYAPAFAALADAYVTLTQGWDALPALETMPKAQRAAQQALALDPNLADAHLALGNVSMFYEWSLPKAEACFQTALRLNPNYAEAHKSYAALLIWLDTRYDDALSHSERAASLDPFDPWVHVWAVFVHSFSRNFHKAIEQARRAIGIAPFYGFAHYALGCALASAGEPLQAIGSFERAISLDGRSSQSVALLGFTYALLGQRDRAMAALTELEEHESAGRNVATWKLHVYAGLRDADHVIHCLEQAIQQRSSSTLFILTHPYVDFVRRDPRFGALLTQAGLERFAAQRWTEWHPKSISS